MPINADGSEKEKRGEERDEITWTIFSFLFSFYISLQVVMKIHVMNIKEEISVHRWSHASSVIVVWRRAAEEGSRLRERELHRRLATYSRVHRYAGSVATDFRWILADGVGAESIDHRYDYESRWTWSREYRWLCSCSFISCFVAVIFSRLQKKCDMYWPKKGSETYGCIQVTLLREDVMATYTIRTLQIRHMKVGTYNLHWESID